MKRMIAGILLIVMLFCSVGCNKEEKNALPLPQRDYYEVTANGRMYTTAGFPFRFEPTEENPGYLNYRSNLVGTVGEDLEGTFPAGTTLHGLQGENNKAFLVAVLPETQYCYLVSSHEAFTVTVGKTVVEPIGFHNEFAYIYRYTKDQTGLVPVAITSSELTSLGTAYGAGELIQPEGDAVEFVMRSFNGDLGLFTLYENGAIVFEGCSQYAIDLGEEMSSILWGYLKG